MFDIQQLVNYLNNGLNEIDADYSFNIYAEVGEQKKDGSINGILRTVSNDTSEIAGNSETRYTFVVEMPIASPRTNSHFLKIEEIVGKFIDENDGQQIEIDAISDLVGVKGKCVFHLFYGAPKNFNVGDIVGDNVPIYFTIKVLYTEGNVTNRDKHWLLAKDEANPTFYEIPYENENVLVNKDGIVRKINSEEFTQAFLTGQTRYYKFVFPYQSTPLCDMIQKDLLSGKINTKYILKYYDGRNFKLNDENNPPFETKVSIYQSGDGGTDKISVSKFNLTFADVDNGEYDWTYQIALIDNPFDNQTENTRWFNSVAEQQAYYESKIALSGNCGYETIEAPNLNSLDITSQVYPNHTGYNVFDLTNKNYAIIKATKTIGQLTQARYFYYWVTNAQIGAGGQVLFDLKLDTVQTYPPFNDEIEFSDCLIERSSLNRFVDNGDGTVSFDGGVNSKLFAREKVQDVPKRLTKRTKLGMCNTGNESFDNWINSYILGWIYCFVSPTSFIGCQLFKNTTDGSQQGNKIKLNEGIYLFGNGEKAYISQPIPCLVFPVLKGGSGDLRARMATIDSLNIEKDIAYSLEKNLDGTINLGTLTNAFEGFVFSDGTNVIYSAKFSTLCPFDNISSTDYEIVNEAGLTSLKLKMTRIQAYNLETSGTFYMYENIKKDFWTIPTSYGTLMVKRLQEPIYDLGYYTVNKTLTFNKSVIVDADKNPQFNPKLLSEDYFQLQICDETENGFTYDLQKLNTNNIQIGLTETLTPDNTKKYIRITNNNGVYSADTDKNLLGFVRNNDQTVVIASDNYVNMLAQNKNFFTQNELGRWERLLSGVSGGISQIGLSSLNPTTLVGGISQTIGSLSGYVIDTIKEDLSIDNLKNAPANIKQALGNCYFGAQYTEPGTYVEEYDILPAEKNVINDYMVQYGFATNQIGQIRDYLNNNPKNARANFNYIKAVINSISGIPMSNTARQDLRDRFAKGIRFWNSDDIDYDKENYEKWLKDDLTGTVWVFKDQPNLYALYNSVVYNINFTSNDTDYTLFTIGSQGANIYDMQYRKTNQTDSVCRQNTSTTTWIWTDNAYKTIEITGGTDSENATLIAWLKANATLVAIKR